MSDAVRFGAYALTGRIGEGGMCHVFRARKDGAAEDCALKLLKEDQRKDPRVLDLFVTEGDLSLLLRHPNLIRTVDAGEHQGRYYIAMELIEGANLGEICGQCARLGVPLPPDFGLYVISEVLEGLGALHEATSKTGRVLGLVHRDVTPSNVFISFDGRVILGDFGIAHIMAYGTSDPGAAVGKVGYLSPEAVSGESLDLRADLFAIGVILWELMTGQRLYAGGSDKTLMRAISEAEVTRPRKLKPGLSREVEGVILRALSRKPRDRFDTARQMAASLEPYWSPIIGNPEALAALMAGLFRDRAQEWRETHPA